MTRRDYLQLSAALKRARDTALAYDDADNCPDILYGIDCAAEAIAESLSEANPKFDKRRFFRDATCDIQNTTGDSRL